MAKRSYLGGHSVVKASPEGFSREVWRSSGPNAGQAEHEIQNASRQQAIEEAQIAELLAQREQLLRAKEENLEAARRIRSQLDRARSAAAANGDYSDRHWFRRANDALRHRGREDQEYGLRLTLLNREINGLQISAWQHRDQVIRPGFQAAFYHVAKRELPSALFQRLIAEARFLAEVSHE